MSVEGIDCLAAAKYPELVLSIPYNVPVGVMSRTFGNVWPVLNELGNRGFNTIRIHAVWDDDHTYNPAVHKQIIMEEWEKVLDFKSKYIGTDILFSPMCEHDFTKKEAREIFGKLRDELVIGVQLVNSPYTGATLKNVWTERHRQSGIYQEARGFSWDGVDVFGDNVAKVRRLYKNAEYMFHWSPHLNLRTSVNDTTPRPDRTYRPKPEHIQTMLEYATRNPMKHHVPKSWIWKPISDDHGDSKSNKIVVITPLDYSPKKLRIKVGSTVVEEMSLYGPYWPEGATRQIGWRYYSRQFAYEMCRKYPAQQMECVGPGVRFNVDPVYRGGKFR